MGDFVPDGGAVGRDGVRQAGKFAGNEEGGREEDQRGGGDGENDGDGAAQAAALPE